MGKLAVFILEAEIKRCKGVLEYYTPGNVNAGTPWAAEQIIDANERLADLEPAVAKLKRKDKKVTKVKTLFDN